MKLKIAIALLSASLLGLGSCRKAPTNTSTSGLATIVCDDSFENIMNQEIDVFEYTTKGNANIIPYYVSEKACIDSLLDFRTKTIVIARDLTEKEKAYLKSEKKLVRSNRIAVDAIALIVNPGNPVEILSEKEIGEILSGEITRWDQIEPSKLGEIQVVFDNEGSSTVQYMRDSLMNGRKFSPNVYAQNSNQEVFAQVQQRKSALGIIEVSWISADMRTRDLPREERIKSLERQDTTVAEFDTSIKVLKVRRDDSIEAYKPYQGYIYDGRYPLYRSIYMITTSANGSLSHGFYSFVTGTIGQKIIQRTGILPARVQPRMVNLN
ncbi:PstS family phosphate ABC transporter substrate-binding protein [uncultured Muribaculum sp.]|uniref:PstS family phosphate ABC transporter substrate-binding protein n=1 Tax=uncultured Muribaculum sp. TaxID=1918613 RepID=UPI00265F9532|nr:substrate-binding domain-containing protein [uncultured Muribaculum sp.]